MRALLFKGEKSAEVVEIPRERPAAGWAVVKVSYSSVCGSDLWMYQGLWHGHTYPIVPGHEWSGVVVETSPGNENWIGKAVIGDLIDACRQCGPCRDGLPVMCENLTEIGFTVNGGCAGYVAVPVGNLYEVPAGLDLMAACQAEPLSVALHAVMRAGVRPGDQVAVLGCGGIGLLIQAAARQAGAHVELAADPVASRRSVASVIAKRVAHPEELPAADDYDEKFDVVFEASGSPASANSAIDLIRPGGTVCLVGYQVGATFPIETARIPLRYASVLGVMGPGGQYRRALDLLGRGSIDPTPLLTDIVPLDDFETSLDRALTRSPGTIRVVFDLTGEN